MKWFPSDKTAMDMGCSLHYKYSVMVIYHPEGNKRI
jgi:hypothetical protein